MVVRTEVAHVGVDEYLAAECESDVKHEYVDGVVYAMAGATLDHNRMQHTLARLLGGHLEGSPCEALGPEIQLQTTSTRYRYPDIVVSCHPDDLRGRGQTRQIAHPTLIVELLSESTEATDRGTKFVEYQGFPEFCEYLLLDTREIGADHFVRQAGTLWTYRHYGPADTLTLESIGLTCPLAAFYARTDLLAGAGD